MIFNLDVTYSNCPFCHRPLGSNTKVKVYADTGKVLHICATCGSSIILLKRKESKFMFSDIQKICCNTNSEKTFNAGDVVKLLSNNLIYTIKNILYTKNSLLYVLNSGIVVQIKNIIKIPSNVTIT